MNSCTRQIPVTTPIHRGVLSELGKPDGDRTSEWTKRSVDALSPNLAEPALPDSTTPDPTISRPLSRVRELEDRIDRFLPRLAEHVGLEIKIEGVIVSSGQQISSTFVIPGAPGLIVPG